MGATSEDLSGRLGALRRRMVSVALRRGFTLPDAEDVVQDALVKLIRQPTRDGAPSLEVRAFTALRDVRVERIRAHERYRRRHVSNPVVGPGTVPAERPIDRGAEDPSILLFEALEMVRAIVGRDAELFARLKAMGATEDDVTDLLGWSAQRTAAARVRLSRSKAKIARALVVTLRPEEELW